MLTAVSVLDDCIRAHNLLDEEEIDPSVWRVKWIGALSLIRMVGHVLEKVDGRDQQVKTISQKLFQEWKDPGKGHLIFTEFIDKQRNLALKEYSFLTDQRETTQIVAAGKVYDIPTDIFRPIVDGPYRNEDARDVYLEAIHWWYQQIERLSEELSD